MSSLCHMFRLSAHVDFQIIKVEYQVRENYCQHLLLLSRFLLYFSGIKWSIIKKQMCCSRRVCFCFLIALFFVSFNLGSASRSGRWVVSDEEISADVHSRHHSTRSPCNHFFVNLLLYVVIHTMQRKEWIGIENIHFSHFVIPS